MSIQQWYNEITTSQDSVYALRHFDLFWDPNWQDPENLEVTTADTVRARIELVDVSFGPFPGGATTLYDVVFKESILLDSCRGYLPSFEKCQLAKGITYQNSKDVKLWVGMTECIIEGPLKVFNFSSSETLILHGCTLSQLSLDQIQAAT